jgi:hypothetical protein
VAARSVEALTGRMPSLKICRQHRRKLGYERGKREVQRAGVQDQTMPHPGVSSKE